MYYSMSEVCAMTGLEPHVLRYWEAEFSKLRPKRNSADKRAYREKDIELINEIKRLLHDEKMTLDGAKKRIADDRRKVRIGADAENGGMAEGQTPAAIRSKPATKPMPVIRSKPATESIPVTPPPPSIPETQKPQLTPPASKNIISDIRKELTGVLSLLEA
jgi:DNA-binding transcriptional MerR regulator